jgi:long-chain acyl-CoA synthetase
MEKEAEMAVENTQTDAVTYINGSDLPAGGHAEKATSYRDPPLFQGRAPRTVPELFWARVSQWSDQVAMRDKDFGIWKEITWRQYGEKARAVALGLDSMGLRKGDPATIMSEDNPEWLFSDLGIICAGGMSAGIYPTDSPSQVEYILNHCEARFHFVEDEEQLDKVLQIRDRVPALVQVFVFDMEGLRDFKDDMVMSFDELLEIGRSVHEKNPGRFDELLLRHQPDDCAIIIYTSGTTGPPKGAMIGHRSILSAAAINRQVWPMNQNDEILCFLPLCHIAERGVSGFGPLQEGYVINFAESSETVPENVREVSPTVFFAVPRIWEKFYSSLMLTLKDATRFEQWAFKRAIAIGYRLSDYKLNLKKPPRHLRALFRLLHWTVLRNVKKSVGLDRVRLCLSGAAPISPELLKFYHALDIDMREVYGQTESQGASTMHRHQGTKFGTVGPPLPDIEIRIAEDGEILIKGPTVFLGYFRDPEKTAETVRDGWLYTGDVGYIDADGHVVITDRKKDIIITSGGKNITPSEIENELKFSPYINDAVVIGDGRNYLTALIMIDDENVMKYAQDNRIPFTTYKSLTQQPEIVKLIDQEIRKVNKKFARVETIKKFRLIDIQLTTDDDEITPTGKLKRNLINEKFKDQIESMYAA